MTTHSLLTLFTLNARRETKSIQLANLFPFWFGRLLSIVRSCCSKKHVPAKGEPQRFHFLHLTCRTSTTYIGLCISILQHQPSSSIPFNSKHPSELTSTKLAPLFSCAHSTPLLLLIMRPITKSFKINMQPLVPECWGHRGVSRLFQLTRWRSPLLLTSSHPFTCSSRRPQPLSQRTP